VLGQGVVQPASPAVARAECVDVAGDEHQQAAGFEAAVHLDEQFCGVLEVFEDVEAGHHVEAQILVQVGDEATQPLDAAVAQPIRCRGGGLDAGLAHALAVDREVGARGAPDVEQRESSATEGSFDVAAHTVEAVESRLEPQMVLERFGSVVVRSAHAREQDRPQRTAGDAAEDRARAGRGGRRVVDPDVPVRLAELALPAQAASRRAAHGWPPSVPARSTVRQHRPPVAAILATRTSAGATSP